MSKWDYRFLDLAKLIASWSKDPSTKCGAVIIRPNNTIVSTGYNGFPTKIKDLKKDYEDRSKKYEQIIHAEMNAIISTKESLIDHTIYTWPMFSCNKCAIHIIQSGIKRVVSPKTHNKRWEHSIKLSKLYFNESNVNYLEIDYE